jgi:cytochrome c oxidase subunit 2
VNATSLTRRECVARALALVALPAVAAVTRGALAQAGDAQVVRLVAQRFHYTPAEFRVVAGQPVLLELSSVDFVHGFNLPDLHLRADLPPGTITRLRFTVDKPGSYDFLCDNFCGDKHEEMNGRMIVVPAGPV